MELFTRCNEDLDLENVRYNRDAAAAVQEAFTVIKVVGRGANAVVLKVRSNRTQKEYAVRLSQVNDQAQKAIKVACAVNALDTPAFVHTYGWIASDARGFMDSPWHRLLQELEDAPQLT